MSLTLRNTGMMLFSTMVSLAFAEIAVRYLIQVRDVGPSLTVHDPVLGRRLKANLRAERTTPEFRMRISTNSLGFRGPEPDGLQRRPILFLGDSFTLGYGVSDGEEFPARIAAELQRRNPDVPSYVINAGVGDAGNGFWVKFLRGKAEAMQPRLVVMQLSDTDFADNVNEMLFAFEADGQTLRELPVPPANAMHRLQAVVEAIPGLSYSYLVGLLRQVRMPKTAWSAPPAGGPALPRRTQPLDHLTLRIVDEAISICMARGWAVLGVAADLPGARQNSVRNLFVERGVPIVVIPARNERPDLYYRVDGHWHTGGHAFAAERVLEALSALGDLNPQAWPAEFRRTGS